MKTKIRIKDFGMLGDIVDKAALIISDENNYNEEGSLKEEKLNEIMTIFQLPRVTMTLETNRYQSLFLCEMLQSYDIQSQRYVRYTGDLDNDTIFTNLDLFSKGEQEAIRNIVSECTQLYLDMSKLKEGSETKAKYTLDDFENGIPIEDARFILPMCFKCNTLMTFEGLHFIELLKLFNMRRDIFDDYFDQVMEEIIRLLKVKAKEEFSDEFNNFVYNLFNQLMNSVAVVTRVASNEYFDSYGKYDQIQDVNLIKDDTNEFSTMRKIGAAALTCTSSADTTEEVFNSCTDEEFSKVAQRVSGDMHHTSISEHGTYNFLFKMSVACYNQYVRARHQQCVREDFSPEISLRNVVPSTISKNSEYCQKYMKTCLDLGTLICKLYENIENDPATSDKEIEINKLKKEAIKQLFPMGLEIRVMCTTNLVNEVYNKAPKRACNKAQWEIRDITNKVLGTIMNDIGKDNRIMDYAKPGCCTSRGCPEGKGRCKDNSNVLKMYK